MSAPLGPPRDLRSAVAELVRRIPEGRVASYGDVAAALGDRRLARRVAWALAALPEGTDVPWHRVVSARGRVSSRADGQVPEEQVWLLRGEGVVADRETGEIRDFAIVRVGRIPT